jgi:hypothetical protein
LAKSLPPNPSKFPCYRCNVVAAVW